LLTLLGKQLQDVVLVVAKLGCLEDYDVYKISSTPFS